MFKIAICDDDSTMLQKILISAKGCIDNQIECEFFSTIDSQQLTDYLKFEDVDILFLDIDMPDITGMEIAENNFIQGNNSLIIFVTNLDTVVYEAIRYHPFRFIRKSYMDEEFPEAIDSAIAELKMRKAVYVLNNGERILLTDIMYFESEHNNIKIKTVNQIYKCRSTLSRVEKEIMSDNFVRIHKGFLINLQYIFKIEGDFVILKNKNYTISLPISRDKKTLLKEKFNQSMR